MVVTLEFLMRVFRATALRAELAATKEREARRVASARWLFDEGHIDDLHEETCPQDDVCDCPVMEQLRVLLNDPEYVPLPKEQP